MKKVRTMQRYQCDFCKKRSVKHIMEIHEKRCFRNPNRFCDYCDNEGTTTEFDENTDTNYLLDCPYCALFDKKKLKEIETREKGTRKGSSPARTDNLEVPF